MLAKQLNHWPHDLFHSQGLYVKERVAVWWELHVWIFGKCAQWETVAMFSIVEMLQEYILLIMEYERTS